jgi:two-component system sensor histidine kinase UhpB
VRLHPPVLDDLGLIKALQNLTRRMGAEHPFDFKMEVSGREPELPWHVKINLYRIVQECLSNVVKHSEAKQALVYFSFHDMGIDLLVTDNGKGCDSRRDEEKVHLGLVSMRERAEQLGGAFNFSSGTLGTTVAVHIPCSGVAELQEGASELQQGVLE